MISLCLISLQSQSWSKLLTMISTLICRGAITARVRRVRQISEGSSLDDYMVDDWKRNCNDEYNYFVRAMYK